jgi:hypothetical protein
MYRNNYNEKRIQLNIRFTKYAELLDEVKEVCHARNISLTDYVASALLSSLGKNSKPCSESTASEVSSLRQKQVKLEDLVLYLLERVCSLEERLQLELEPEVKVTRRGLHKIESSDKLIIRTASEINADEF